MPIRETPYIARVKVAHWEYDSPSTKAFCVRDIENETGNKPLVCLNPKASRLCSGMRRAPYKRS
ncbi:hypothetical protein BOTCAL_0022g00400 [Botryotinia calthae]|uniref:Uncharacterized protein n=1 Tax=Botryotinia calthae TaxID=38488 RepID=A0A4Y8DEZ6_9HELO|nr:hypothetical protein BOTCAL_0022g00400 [Botryotinia calthae]